MTENRTPKVGGLLLAAGGSSRMGRPKQLIRFESQTLLRRAAATLINAKCDPLVVVLGAEIESSQNELSDLELIISINHDWKTGMSSSIKTGLETLLQWEPGLDAIVITLCDQPHITTENLDLLIDKFTETGSDIIAADYNGVTGVPALFSRRMFDELFRLVGDKGARDLLRDNTRSITRIDMPSAAVDIDSPSDLE